MCNNCLARHSAPLVELDERFHVAALCMQFRHRNQLLYHWFRHQPATRRTDGLYEFHSTLFYQLH